MYIISYSYLLTQVERLKKEWKWCNDAAFPPSCGVLMYRWKMEIQKYSKFLGIVSISASLILSISRFTIGKTNIVLQQNLFLLMMIFFIIGIISNGIHYGLKYSSSNKEAIIVVYINILALPIFIYLLILYF